MLPNDEFNGARGVVVAYVPDLGAHASEHERHTLLEFARRLAALKGYDMGGFYEPARQAAGPVYFVPSQTLSHEQAASLGIHGPDDLYGGVVPHRFVSTKAITHPLVAANATAVAGWNPAFAEQVRDAVLPGYTVFNLDDARQAGLRLLAHGPLRVKPVRATGGHGQSVARDAAQLQQLLSGVDSNELAAHGLVLEQDLAELRTFSVGQVRVARLVASYFGSQRLTRNNKGDEVFGGSQLTVVRGDFDALLASEPEPEVAHAIEQARCYDAAVQACYPGFYASRRNYDVLLGRDAAGRWRSGVLEQSWRVGGATGPEIAALEAFRSQPQRALVRAASVEIYGDSPEPPAHATVYYRGTDPRVGLLTKYTVIEPHVDAR